MSHDTAPRLRLGIARNPQPFVFGHPNTSPGRVPVWAGRRASSADKPVIHVGRSFRELDALSLDEPVLLWGAFSRAGVCRCRGDLSLSDRPLASTRHSWIDRIRTRSAERFDYTAAARQAATRTSAVLSSSLIRRRRWRRHRPPRPL